MSLTLRPVPEPLFRPDTRHLAVFAHQDDETGYLGLMKRIAPNARALWVTNGDGLAPFEKVDPEVYAAKRKAESTEAMRIVGFSPDQLDFLGHSEISIYDELKAISLVPAKQPLPDHLKQQLRQRAAQIQERIAERVAQADVVWALAFQGGHPEHDLAHYLTFRAVRDARKSGREIAFFELPEYELMFFVPLRFPPWKKGEGHVIELTDQELDLKEKAMSAYPTQMGIIRSFDKLISVYGALSALRLKPFSFKSFSRLEYFAPTPNRDYTRSPHGAAALDYIREYHEKARIAFDTTLARWIRLLEEDA